MKCHISIRTQFPAAIKGIKLHNGPIPRNFAAKGEMTATVSPEERPQVITEMINIMLTSEPVIRGMPKGAVAACKAMSRATKMAVRVIQSTRFLFVSIIIFSHPAYEIKPHCFSCCIIVQFKREVCCAGNEIKILDNIIEALGQSKLFAGIAQRDIEEMLVCLHARRGDFAKGEMLFREGDAVNETGVVLFGHARSIKDDPSGKTTIVTLLQKGDFIGVLLAASLERRSPVSVQALDALCVMFFPIESIMGRCVRLCRRHDVLSRNFLDGIAEKALHLHDRNDCLIKPTVREKILTYLMREAKVQGRRAFTIPFDRSGMSEYLNVERSALSRELSRMKKDGLIDFFKSDFRLY